VLPFFKDLIAHLCDRPSSLSKQVWYLFVLFTATPPLLFQAILRSCCSGCLQLQPLSWKCSSSPVSPLCRHCASNGGSSRGGCSRRFCRGMSHRTSDSTADFLSNHSLSVSKLSFSPKQIVSNAARRYSKAHRDAIKRVWPPSLDARAPVQVIFTV